MRRTVGSEGQVRLRVGIDVSSAIDAQPTGIARYIRCLVTALGSLEDAPELTLFARPSRRRRGRPAALFPGVRTRWLWGATRGVEVFHATDVRLPRRSSCPVVTTLHDLSALRRSDHATPRFVERKRHAYRRAARDSARLITPSACVAREVVERLAVPAASVVAIPHADPLPPPPPDEVRTFPPRPAALLTVGGPSVRKGSLLAPALLESWSDRLAWRPELLWVGDGDSTLRDRICDELPPPLRERVHFLGRVSDERLASLYARVDGLLLLSESEGFGIPLLEAAGRRCPVLAVESEAPREVLPEAAVLFRDASHEDAFRRFLDPTERARIAERAHRIGQRHSWRETAVRTLRVYQQAAGS